MQETPTGMAKNNSRYEWTKRILGLTERESSEVGKNKDSFRLPGVWIRFAALGRALSGL